MPVSYTLVVSSAFLDWGLMVGFIANPKGGKQRIFDGGSEARSMSLLSDVGKAVVGILRNPEETKNRAVYIQSTAVSQNKLLELVKKANPSVDFEIESVDTAQLEQDCYGILGQKDGNIMQAMYGFISVSIFRDGYGGRFGNTDNELFGIKELSEEDLKAVVAKYA